MRQKYTKLKGFEEGGVGGGPETEVYKLEEVSELTSSSRKTCGRGIQSSRGSGSEDGVRHKTEEFEWKGAFEF